LRCSFSARPMRSAAGTAAASLIAIRSDTRVMPLPATISSRCWGWLRSPEGYPGPRATRLGWLQLCRWGRPVRREGEGPARLLRGRSAAESAISRLTSELASAALPGAAEQTKEA
jgi:hypothetical protein